MTRSWNGWHALGLALLVVVAGLLASQLLAWWTVDPDEASSSDRLLGIAVLHPESRAPRQVSLNDVPANTGGPSTTSLTISNPNLTRAALHAIFSFPGPTFGNHQATLRAILPGSNQTTFAFENGSTFQCASVAASCTTDLTLEFPINRSPGAVVYATGDPERALSSDRDRFATQNGTGAWRLEASVVPPPQNSVSVDVTLLIHWFEAVIPDDQEAVLERLESNETRAKT